MHVVVTELRPQSSTMISIEPQMHTKGLTIISVTGQETVSHHQSYNVFLLIYLINLISIRSMKSKEAEKVLDGS